MKKEIDNKTMNCSTSILSAIDRINSVVRNSALNPSVISEVDSELTYLSSRLNITAVQAMLLSVCLEESRDEEMSVNDIAKFLDITYAKALAFVEDLKQLGHMRLLDVSENGYSISERAMKSITANKDYCAPKRTELKTSSLISYMHECIGSFSDTEILQDELEMLIRDNLNCGIIKKLAKLKIKMTSCKVILMLCDALLSEGRQKVSFDRITRYWDDNTKSNNLAIMILNGQHELIQRGLVGLDEKRLDERNNIFLTEKAKGLLFNKKSKVNKINNSELSYVANVILPSTIAEKSLYYGENVDRQINELSRLLNEENYKAVHDRLSQSNLRCGFACLFYGAPGTGKTETVYQLARATGREIMMVDVPNIRDMFVGETEKNIKQVFTSYKKLKATSKLTPILLFNEADALFGTRQMQPRRSVDKMENAMQNILLQSMEDFDGILIATSNLSENLDDAFERRFLYKVQFESPTVKARQSIWSSMLPELKENEAVRLAESFVLSGGQIENVIRKFTIGRILYGENTSTEDMHSLLQYCREETLKSSGQRIGFQ